MKSSDWTKEIRVASPCKADWNAMKGDDRIRHCDACDLNVYNFASLTVDEIADVLQRAEGRVCARLYRRRDGTLLTADCPVGRWQRLRARVVGAASAVAMLAGLAVFTNRAQSEDASGAYCPRSWTARLAHLPFVGAFFPIGETLEEETDPFYREPSERLGGLIVLPEDTFTRTSKDRPG